MGERIKKLRKALGLTQKEFGERIGVKPNTIATYEIGRNEPIDAVISLICREFSVSEQWLRTGEGEMLVPQTREDEISAIVERILTGESADFKRRLILALSTLREEHWRLLETKIKEIAGVQDSKPAKLYIAASDGGRYETEVDGGVTLPESDTQIQSLRYRAETDGKPYAPGKK